MDRSPLESGNRLAFGDFSFSPSERVLERAGQPVRLGGRPMDILVALVEQAGQIVSQRELFARVWPDQAVDASILRVHITTLRKALGGGECDAARYIANVPGRGYSFVAALSAMPAAEPDAALPLTNLSLPLTEIIGRERELTELAQWLARSRLVTLVGPGGVGKTRLAVELGRRLLGDYPAGIWLIDLAPLVADPDAVASALASALGVSVSKAEGAVDSIVARLGKTRPLLIFDNCEHLAEVAAALIRNLLERTPGVSILATSQTDLHLAAEQVYGLDPLAVPPAGDREIQGYAAAELFSRRARAADRTFTLHEGNSVGVSEICRRLDGLPLALEMAAGRVRMLGVEGLRRGLDERLKILKGAPDGDVRHASLHGMLEWSHSLLAPFDQKVFRRLAVFRGSFSLDAVVAVAGQNEVERWLVVDALGRLIDRSLVTLAQHEPARYRLLETLRFHATDKLREAGESDAVAALHARHLIAVFEAAEACWEETPDPDWLARYQPELDNLRAALDWALAKPERAPTAIALAAASCRLLYELSLVAEGLRYLDQIIPLLDATTPATAAARLLRHAALSCAKIRDPRGRAFAERSVAIFRELGDAPGLAAPLIQIAQYKLWQREPLAAQQILLDANALLPDGKFRKIRLNLKIGMGIVAYAMENFSDALQHFSEAMEIARQVKSLREVLILSNIAYAEYASGNIDRSIELSYAILAHPFLLRGTNEVGVVLVNLGSYLIAKEKFSEARSKLKEALSFFVERGSFPASSLLQAWAVLAGVEGRLAEATQLIGYVDASRAQLGPAREPAEIPLYNKLMAILAAALPPAERDALKGSGAQWAEAEAVAFVADRLATAQDSGTAFMLQINRP